MKKRICDYLNVSWLDYPELDPDDVERAKIAMVVEAQVQSQKHRPPKGADEDDPIPDDGQEWPDEPDE